MPDAAIASRCACVALFGMPFLRPAPGRLPRLGGVFTVETSELGGTKLTMALDIEERWIADEISPDII